MRPGAKTLSGRRSLPAGPGPGRRGAAHQRSMLPPPPLPRRVFVADLGRAGVAVAVLAGEGDVQGSASYRASGGTGSSGGSASASGGPGGGGGTGGGGSSAAGRADW